MAVVTVAHNPALTKEHAFEVFTRHFEGKYRVTGYSGIVPRDFLVIKNQFLGAGVKLEQDKLETRFIFSVIHLRGSPLYWLGALGRLAGVLIVCPLFGRGLFEEVRQFIQQAPEFNRLPTL